MKPAKPPREPWKVVAKLCQSPCLRLAKQRPAMTRIMTILSQVRRVWSWADSRVLTMLRAVMSQVAAMARIWDQRSGPIAAWSRKAKMGKVPRTRMRPAAMVAMEAGLARVVQVQV